MTQLNTAEEYLEDQHNLDLESDHDFRLEYVRQIIKYLKSLEAIPTYGMVFDMECWLADNLYDILKDFDYMSDSLDPRVEEIIKANTNVEILE